MTYDNFFKQLLRDFLTHCEIHPDSPVGKLPLKIDLIIKCPQKSIKTAVIPLLETHFAYLNLVEYKSSHDIPKRHDLMKLIGYLGLYCDQYQYNIQDVTAQFTLWYITAKRPAFYNILLKKGIIIQTEIFGLYQLQASFLCPYFLLVINELDISEENLPLLLLSSGNTLRNTIRLMVQKDLLAAPALEKYLSFVYLLNYKDVSDMTEIQNVFPDHIRKNIKQAIMAIGIKEVIYLIGLGEVIKEVGLGEVIKE
ncbi:MAG: hypothetical protein ACTSRC_21320, partial [Candidatus Helarchaeota archaeon]